MHAHLHVLFREAGAGDLRKQNKNGRVNLLATRVCGLLSYVPFAGVAALLRG